MFEKVRNKFIFSDIVLLLSIFCVGGFNEHISCLLSCLISIYFFIKIFTKKEIKFQANLFSVAITVLCLFYGLTCFWAIDAGMALIGFFKFMPILLYALLLWQE